MNIMATTLTLAVLIALGAGCTREDAVLADADMGEDRVDLPVVDPVEPVGTEGLAGAGTAPTLAGWDTSRDGMLDENEFNTGFNQGAWFNDWDTDNDGNLTEAEFQTVNAGWGDAPGGVDENGLFDTWDADEDGLIDNQEFTTGVYSTWDADDNNLIDTTEYDAGLNWFGWT